MKRTQHTELVLHKNTGRMHREYSNVIIYPPQAVFKFDNETVMCAHAHVHTHTHTHMYIQEALTRMKATLTDIPSRLSTEFVRANRDRESRHSRA